MHHMCNTETHTLLYMSSNSTKYRPNGFISHDIICLIQYRLQCGKYKGNIHGSSLHGAYNLNEETSNIYADKTVKHALCIEKSYTCPPVCL